MTFRTPPSPPAHVIPFVQIMGTEETARFLMTFGGADIRLGRQPRSTNQVARAFGRDVAAAIGAGQYEGTIPVRIPLAKPWLARVLKHQGLSGAEIARRLHVGEEAVRGYLRAGKPTPPKALGDLFDN